MKKSMINVVAGIFIRDNKILICQRSDNTSYPLLWEFPGGKIEAGEGAKEALQRELYEELNINATINEHFITTTVELENVILNISFYMINNFSGTININTHNDAKWINISELNSFEFPPADVECIEKLLDIY